MNGRHSLWPTYKFKWKSYKEQFGEVTILLACIPTMSAENTSDREVFKYEVMKFLPLRWVMEFGGVVVTSSLLFAFIKRPQSDKRTTAMLQICCSLYPIIHLFVGSHGLFHTKRVWSKVDWSVVVVAAVVVIVVSLIFDLPQIAIICDRPYSKNELTAITQSSKA